MSTENWFPLWQGARLEISKTPHRLVMKSKTIFFLTALLLQTTIFAQVSYSGTINDIENQQSLPYVNIGILNKGIGTVTDELGRFSLNIWGDNIKPTDTLQISSLGYRTIKMTVEEIDLPSSNDKVIYMEPFVEELNEVIISNKGYVPIIESVGYRNQGEDNYGYWKDNIALGGELATKIKVNKKRRRLETFEFEIAKNSADSLLIRVNFYDNNWQLGIPKSNLNTSKKSILYKLKKDEIVVRIDVSPYDIYVEDDFYVSLELVDLYDNDDLELVLAATGSLEGSYRKYASQGDWEKISDLNMAFYVETMIMVDQKKAVKHQAKIEKEKLKQRMIAGFAIYGGKMIQGVTVLNKRTKEIVSTDASGRYTIHADDKDLLYFTKSGYEKEVVQIGDEQFVNANMQKTN